MIKLETYFKMRGFSYGNRNARSPQNRGSGSLRTGSRRGSEGTVQSALPCITCSSCVPILMAWDAAKKRNLPHPNKVGRQLTLQQKHFCGALAFGEYDALAAIHLGAKQKGHKRHQDPRPIWSSKSKINFDARFGNRRLAASVANGLGFPMFFGLTPTLVPPDLAGGWSIKPDSKIKGSER